MAADQCDDIVSNIPEWLLWEVLVRLPSKSVVRCKLVSKQWASLISNPLFVRSYLSQHYPSSSSWTVISDIMIKDEEGDLTFVEHNLPKYICSRKNFGSLRLPDNAKPGQRWHKVFGASDGLILFGPIDLLGLRSYLMNNIYYLCNPVTRQSIPLPPLPMKPSLLVVDHRHYWGPLGLITRVQDAVLESFRVVVLLPPPETNNLLRFCVYASETLQWREFVLPCEIPLGDIVETAPNNDSTNQKIVHFVTKYGYIIAYDPYANPDRMIVTIPPPPRDAAAAAASGYFQMCDASGGKLWFFDKLAYEEEDGVMIRFKLWVLESDDWRLSHDTGNTIIIRGDDAALLKDLRPVFFDPVDAGVVHLADRRALASYDFRTGQVRGIDNTGRHPKQLAFWVWVSPWPVSMSNVPCFSGSYRRDYCGDDYYDEFLSSQQRHRYPPYIS